MSSMRNLFKPGKPKGSSSRNGHYEEEDTKMTILEETDGGLEIIQSDEFQRMAELFRLMTEVQKYGGGIDIPRFVLVGNQSAGKSTVVNQLLKFPASFSQDGTGTRCPTMYFIEQSEDRNSKIMVYFEDELLGSWHELHGKVRSHMERLKDEDRFSPDPITVKVISPHVSNFVIVDLPGLIRTNNPARQAIDEMVRRYLLEELPNQRGEYNAIPIVIRACGGKEVDDTFQRIDDLVGRERPGWKDEPTTVVILNKLDEKSNYGSAEDFLNALEELRKECRPLTPIFTCLRPPGDDGRIPAAHILHANPDQHQEYLRNIPRFEKSWGDEKFAEYIQGTTNNKAKKDLRNVKKGEFGFPKFETQVAVSMKNIVQQTARRAQMTLGKTERKYNEDVAKLNTAIQETRPEKFRELKETLLTKFLQKIKDLNFQGEVDIADFCKTTWEEEFQSLDNRLLEVQDGSFIQFREDFELPKSDLQKLYREEKHPILLRELKCRLAGVAKLDRMLNAWKAMVCCMIPTRLEWEQKRNMKGGHRSTMDGSFHDELRNLLKHMLKRTRNAVKYLAEALRCHYFHQADKVCEFLSERELGANLVETEDNAKMIQIQFLEDIRDDYKGVISRTIDKFVMDFYESERLELVDLTLPNFVRDVAGRLQKALKENQLQLEQFQRESREGNARDPEPNVHVPDPEKNLGDPQSGSEAEYSDDDLKDPDDSATEPQESPIRDLVGGITRNFFGPAVAMVGDKMIDLLVNRDIYFENAMQHVRRTKKLAGKVREVDLFNACMQKKIIFDLGDNEKHASACAALHRQIYQFILIHNVGQRVDRVVNLLNEEDEDGYVSLTMRNGHYQNDVKRAITQLSYSYEFGADGVQKLEEFLAQFQRDPRRLSQMSDDEVRERFGQGHKALLEKKAEVIKERKEFLRTKNEIMTRLRAAGLMVSEDAEEQHSMDRRGFSPNPFSATEADSVSRSNY